MIDLFKYTALNENGDIFIGINVHNENYSDRFSFPYSLELGEQNQLLRVYKYRFDLLEENRELIADELIDVGTTTMKANNTHIVIATGQEGGSKDPLLQVITLIDKSVKTYNLRSDISEIVDLI